jgi:mannan endo-1,4-beta-mannosidase
MSHNHIQNRPQGWLRFAFVIGASTLAGWAGQVEGEAGKRNEVTVTVRLDLPKHDISELIYGGNIDAPISGFSKYTVLRIGGNAVTTYNWENNANNAGDDYQHSSGGWVARFAEKDPELKDRPAAGYLNLAKEARKMGAYPLVQLQTAGFVAADKNGPVLESETAPSKRWKRVVPAKGAPFSLTPDTTDDAVYEDECVNYLVQTLGSAKSGRGVRGYLLDNEVDNWYLKHGRMHPKKQGAAEVLSSSIALASAVKAVDPDAEVMGPGLMHVTGYDSCGTAEDWPEIKKRGGYRWYIDYFLDEFRRASEKSGHRLLDALDIHAYLDDEVSQAGGWEGVLQGPRWLWDPTNRQASWIGEVFPEHFPLLPKLQASIDKYYPGTKIAITEYNCGAGLYGTPYCSIALADQLGVYGRHNVYLATIWGMLDYDSADYAEKSVAQASALKLYRDFDGNGGTFGTQSVVVENPRPDLCSVYASVDAGTGELHLISLGKTRHIPTRVTVKVVGGASGQTAVCETWGYDQANMRLGFLGESHGSGSEVSMDLPKLSARHSVLSAGGSKYRRAPQPVAAARRGAGNAGQVARVPLFPSLSLEQWHPQKDEASGEEQARRIATENSSLVIDPKEGFRLAARCEDPSLPARLIGKDVEVVASTTSAGSGYREVGLAMVGEGVPFTLVGKAGLPADGKPHALSFDFATVNEALQKHQGSGFFVLWIVTNTGGGGEISPITVHSMTTPP